MRKNYKKLTAVALTAVMTFGCTMTAFAANATSGDVNGGAGISGTGSYEGAEAEYQVVSITLPTTNPTDINYIVDPNNLIKSTMDASGDAIRTTYADSDFIGDTGVYFKVNAKSGDVRALYADKSAPIRVRNESAQDVKLTVKVTSTPTASGDVAFNATDNFAENDKAKKLYLAVTDGTTTKALGGASGDATFESTVKGNPDNFEADHDGSKYTYSVKNDASGDAGEWATLDYKLTGAVNKNAEWGENIQFPSVQMTWRWEDTGVSKDAGPSVSNVTYSRKTGGALTIPCYLGRGESVAEKVTDAVVVGTDGKLYSANGAWNSTKVSGVKVENDTVTLDASWMSGMQKGESQVSIVFDNDLENYVAMKVTVTN